MSWSVRMAVISSLLTLAAAGCGERFAQGSSDGGSGGKDTTASSASSGGGGEGQGGTTTGSTSSSPSTGTGGRECVYTGPEQCNGIDDDCYQGIDDGCPTDLQLGAGTFDGYDTFNAPVVNNFQEVCLPGYAIFQISGFVDEGFTPPAINTIQATCAEVVLVENTSTMPYSYHVTRGSMMTMTPPHGGMMGTPFTLTCEGERFAIGLSGVADEDPNLGLQQSRLHCAELQVIGTPGDFTLQHGLVQVVSDGPLNPTYSDSVEEPLLMNRYRGRAEMWVQSIGIGEVTPMLVFR